jgi:hypothetical protein
MNTSSCDKCNGGRVPSHKSKSHKYSHKTSDKTSHKTSHKSKCSKKHCKTSNSSYSRYAPPNCMRPPTPVVIN